MDTPPPDSERSWTRHAGIGIEFAGAVAGFALLGYWIDRHYDSSPWGVLIGAALGLIGGTYNLIRASMAAFKRYERDPKPRDAAQTSDKDEQD